MGTQWIAWSVCIYTKNIYAIWRLQEGSLFLINIKPPFNDTIASRCSPLMPNICKKLIYEKSLTDFFARSIRSHSFQTRMKRTPDEHSQDMINLTNKHAAQIARK